MKFTGRIALLAVVAGCFLSYTALAQSTSGQNQANQNQANQSQSQDQDQQYSGVSHPPPDDTIEANEDQAPPASNAPAPAPKPSPAIPVMPPPAANNAAASNDDGIVTGSFDQANAPALATRGENPDYGIVSVVPDDPHALGEGTNLRVELSEDLSSDVTPRGTAFEAKVVRNVYKDGRVIIPIGAVMRGHVTEVSEGHHLGMHASIRLTPDSVVLPDGTEYHLLAQTVESTATGTKVNQEGVIEASVRYRKDALEYGAGAGAGAAAGAAIGGPVGAGVGALAGTGAVTAHMLMTHPEAANLPQGTVLIFSLTQPMGIATAKN